MWPKNFFHLDTSAELMYGVTWLVHCPGKMKSCEWAEERLEYFRQAIKEKNITQTTLRWRLMAKMFSIFIIILNVASYGTRFTTTTTGDLEHSMKKNSKSQLYFVEISEVRSYVIKICHGNATIFSSYKMWLSPLNFTLWTHILKQP